MVGRGTSAVGNRKAWESGFTLFEVLAALAVMGIATGIFASLFIASINLGHLNQSTAVAASLAEGQVLLVRNHPEGFAWPNAEALAAGEFVAVPARDTAGNELSATSLPSVMPFDGAANTRDRNFYQQFSSEVLVRLPGPDSGYVEFAAVIRWQEKGKPQSFTLTSALPRSLVEGGS